MFCKMRPLPRSRVAVCRCSGTDSPSVHDGKTSPRLLIFPSAGPQCDQPGRHHHRRVAGEDPRERLVADMHPVMNGSTHIAPTVADRRDGGDVASAVCGFEDFFEYFTPWAVEGFLHAA